MNWLENLRLYVLHLIKWLISIIGDPFAAKPAPNATPDKITKTEAARTVAGASLAFLSIDGLIHFLEYFTANASLFGKWAPTAAAVLAAIIVFLRQFKQEDPTPTPNP